MPQTIRVHYFNARGYGEAIRLLLTYRNVDFEDIRYEHGSFPKEKFEFGRVPVLETDGGQQLSESQQVARVTRAHVTASCLACSAILSFLAKKYGLGGGTDREAAEINALAFFYTDFVREQLPYMMILAGRREGDKEKAYRDIFLPTLEKFVPVLERQLVTAGNGFMHKSGLSWVDFYAANFFLTMRLHAPDEFKKYKSLNEHCDRIHALPELKTYMSKRPAQNV